MYSINEVLDIVKDEPLKVRLPNYDHLDNVKVVKTIRLPFKSIHINDNEDNLVKEFGHEPANIEKLVKSFSAGVLLSEAPPAVFIRNGEDFDKPYELLYGFGRSNALETLGMKEWFFTLIEVDDFSKWDVRLCENEPLPKSFNKERDIERVLKNKVSSGHIPNTEDAIKKELYKILPHRDQSSGGRIISNVCEGTKAYIRYFAYNATKIGNWLEDHSSEEYVVGGNYDSERDMYGFICGEGAATTPKAVFNALRKYTQTGKSSYFICHVNPPGKNKSLHNKRLDLIERFNSLLGMLNSLGVDTKFIKIMGFVPQENYSENWKKLIEI